MSKEVLNITVIGGGQTGLAAGYYKPGTAVSPLDRRILLSPSDALLIDSSFGSRTALARGVKTC
jgi:hypothetical protein